MIDLTKPTKRVIEDVMHACRENRQLFVKEWVKNNRRLAGFTEEDVYPIDVSTADTATRHESADLRYVTSFNRTRGFFQRLLGRMMPVITNYQVVAASTDEDDKDAAIAGGELLEARVAVDSGRDFEEVTRGISYLFAGGPAYLNIEGNEEDREVDVRAVLPFDMYYYPGIRRLADSPAIVVTERQTQQDIERRFPELAEKIEKRTGADGETGWRALTPAKWPNEVNYEGVAGKIGEGMFLLRHLYIRPCGDFPEGDHCLMVDGADDIKTVWGQIGSADGEYPFEELADVPMGPFYEDRGRMSISGAMQRVYDIAISKMLDLSIGASQMNVNFPPGCDANEDDYTNKPILFSHSPDALKPTVQPLDTLGSLPQIVELAGSAMDEVHAQHGPSRGQIPGTRTSGRALEQMVAQDVASDEPLMAMLRRAMGRAGKRILLEGQRVWGDSHPFLVLGRNRRFQAKAFKSADLKEGFSVRVLPDDGLPKNKVARMKMIMGWAKEGLLSDTVEARRARDMIGSPVDDDLYAAEPSEEQLIRREEEQISLGVDVPVNWSDDHMLHRMRHRARNTERLSTGDSPEQVQEAAMGHDLMHQQRMQEEMMAAMPPQPAGPPAGGTQ